MWLKEFGLINICYNLSKLELPLNAYKIDDEFKIYVADTGLFFAMLEKGTTNNILNGDLKIYKGQYLKILLLMHSLRMQKTYIIIVKLEDLK